MQDNTFSLHRLHLNGPIAVMFKKDFAVMLASAVTWTSPKLLASASSTFNNPEAMPCP